MKYKANEPAFPDNWRAESIPPQHPIETQPRITHRAGNSLSRSGANAAFLTAVLCGLWFAGISLPAQEATNELTDAVVSPAGPPTATTVEASETATGEGMSETPGTDKPKGLRRSSHQSRGGSENAKVVFGKDAEVSEGETVDALVVIGGNATVVGKVREAAVVIGGNLTVRGDGEVGDAAVAVLGGVNLDDQAVVHGDAVAVGGAVQVAENAQVEGQKQSVDFGTMGLPQLKPLRDWFLHCVLKLRPLAPQVGWVWAVAGIVFLFYLLAAVALPKPVGACVGELTRRPATTFFMGVLAELMLPLLLVILAATGIGLIVVPFLLAALCFGAIIGKVAFLEYLGFGIQKAIGITDTAKPIIALVIGSIILAGLYVVPVLGLITLGVTGMWGLGAAVTAAFGGLKRESPGKAASAASALPRTTGAPPPGLTPMPVMAAGVNATSVQPAGTTAAPEAIPNPVGGGSATTPPPTPVQTTTMPEALVHPRAGFWERMGAAFLDVVLVSILGGLAGPFFLLVALAYFAGMWAWKGTTIGGIVLNLKVVRLDGSPMTFAAALVRGLAAAFSVVVLFLGFLWIIWDPEKQGWHDRIAGTVVVRLPRGVPLVCL